MGKHHSIRALGLAAALSMTTGLLANPAHAEDATDPAAVEAAATANIAAGQSGISQEVTAEGTSADLGNGAVEVSTDPSDGLTVTAPTGTDISLGVPGETDDGTVVGSNVVYPDVATDAAVVARATPEGAQALIVIDGNSAPERYTFPIEVNGQDTVLRESDDGGIEVISPDSTDPVATVAPPWATDAHGAPVSTHYEIEGSSIIQVVDHHGAAYPVTADPKYSWGYVTGTAYYNRKETRSLKTRSYAYVVAAGLCAAFGGATAGAACAVGAAVAAQWNYVASNAYGDGKCVKIKMPIMWAYAYSGGNCK